MCKLQTIESSAKQFMGKGNSSTLLACVVGSLWCISYHISSIVHCSMYCPLIFYFYFFHLGRILLIWQEVNAPLRHNQLAWGLKKAAILTEVCLHWERSFANSGPLRFSSHLSLAEKTTIPIILVLLLQFVLNQMRFSIATVERLNLDNSFLMQQGKKWAYPLQRFKAHSYIAVIFRRQRENCYYLHNEPSTLPSRAIQEHAFVCKLC